MLSIVAFAALAQAAAPNLWRWQNDKFGLFVHWGPYAVAADNTTFDGKRATAEWYLSNKRLRVREYEKLAPRFDPTKFDARRWVAAAKGAGMKYIVITSKHHDGFAMWDTALSDWSITKATPFRRDPIRELAREARRQGLRFGLYYSIMDWHNPDYLPRRAWDDRPTAGADFGRYIEFMKGQLRELLTGYGKISVLWFDGGWEHTAAEMRSQEVNDLVRSLQPGILINDRNGLPGDFATPEQTIPAGAMPEGRPWETCMTMNDTWGYARADQNWKSPTDLIRKLFDIASKGGNFLLNVGPTAEGEIPAPSLDRLASIGKWMRVNGQAIYGAQKSPFRRLPFDGRVTRKGNALYVAAFRLPADGRLELPGLRTPIVAARVLGGGRVRIDGPAVVADVPKPDPAATVIELRLAGPPVVTIEPIDQSNDGALDLNAADADLVARNARVEESGGRPNIGFWTDVRDTASWTFRLRRGGRYRIEVELAADDASAGATFDFTGLSGTVPATGGWQSYRALVLGELDMKPGVFTFTLKPKSAPNGAVMNLRRVRLVPVSP